MRPYRSYHHAKPASAEGGLFRVGKIFLMLLAIVLLFLIVKGMFGSSDEPQVVDGADQAITPSIASINSSTNSATGDSANVNAVANVNTASNTNTHIDSNTVAIDATLCNQVYSRGSSSAQQVTLTFNVGTTKEGALPALLAALQTADAPAAFFARGDVATENPSLIQKISDAGFPVYNLTNTHVRPTDVTPEELTEELAGADAAIQEIAGIASKPFFRPPYGATDDEVVATAAEAGYCTVTWTIDAMDWSSDYTPATSQARVLDTIANGSIVLMQASNATTAEIVPNIISAVRNQGYTLVDLPTLLDL